MSEAHDAPETRPPDIVRVVDGWWGFKPLTDKFEHLVEDRFNQAGQNPIVVKVWIDRQ